MCFFNKIITFRVEKSEERGKFCFLLTRFIIISQRRVKKDCSLDQLIKFVKLAYIVANRDVNIESGVGVKKTCIVS
jgi:hypothetical protein